MPLGDVWSLLIETLRTQKLRSLLTILGIVIGIAAVVLLSSIGEGTREGIARQFTQFGTTIVSVVPGRTETFGGGPGYMGGTTHPLTIEDADALRRIPGVRWVAPNLNGVGEVKAGQRSRHTYIYGVLHDGQYVWQWFPIAGTWIPDGDPELIPAVCVLGAKPAKELFPDSNPLGAYVHIAQSRFRVIGVMSEKGQMLGFDLDDSVYIPLVRAMKLFNRDRVQEIHLYVSSHAMIPYVENEAKRILKERHGGEEDVTILTQTDMLDVIDRVMTVLTGGVIVIAAISVFVGAMGILTIMWVSVHERTQEIGLIKAVGASDRQVMLVFLSEAAVLSVLGGAAGVAAGLAFGWMLRTFIGLWVQVPTWVVPMALGTSLAVGILAGVVPAVRAARLDPVEALRTE